MHGSARLAGTVEASVLIIGVICDGQSPPQGTSSWFNSLVIRFDAARLGTLRFAHVLRFRGAPIHRVREAGRSGRDCGEEHEAGRAGG